MKAGIAKRDITPHETMYLDGQISRTKPAQGVLDLLYTTVLALEIKTEPLLLINYDLIDLPRCFSDEIIEAVSQKTGINKNNIIPGFSHTHSGPSFLMDEVWSFEYCPETTRSYRNGIVKKTVQAAIEALENLENVRLYIAKTTVDGVYGNRNDIHKQCDKDVTHLVFRGQNERTVAAILHFACHPTVLGPSNYFYSADIAGYARNLAEKKWNCDVLFMQGAAGDMGNRQYRKGEDSVELARVGEQLANQIFTELSWEEISASAIQIKQCHFEMKTKRNKKQLTEQLESTQKEIQQETNQDTIKLLKTTERWLVYLLQQPLDVHLLFDSWIIFIGKLVLVTMPAEPASVFSLQLKRRYKKYHLLVCGYIYYSNGYLIEQEVYGESFESQTSDISKGVAERYIKSIIQQMDAILE